MKHILYLAPNVTQVLMPRAQRLDAVQAAYRICMSPHEHEWTPDEQRAMAQYVLWAAQRIAAIDELANGNDLIHQPAPGAQEKE